MNNRTMKEVEDFIKYVEGNKRFGWWFNNTEGMDKFEYGHALRVYYWSLPVLDKDITNKLLTFNL